METAQRYEIPPNSYTVTSWRIYTIVWGICLVSPKCPSIKLSIVLLPHPQIMHLRKIQTKGALHLSAQAKKQLCYIRTYEKLLTQCLAGGFFPHTVIHDPVVILAGLNQLWVLFLINFFINTCEVLYLPSYKFEKAQSGVKVLNNSDEKIVKFKVEWQPEGVSCNQIMSSDIQHHCRVFLK